MQIFLRALSGKTVTLDVDMRDTISEVMIQIESKEGIPHALQRLVFSGKQLEHNFTLDSYGIRKESTLHLLLRVTNNLLHSRQMADEGLIGGTWCFEENDQERSIGTILSCNHKRHKRERADGYEGGDLDCKQRPSKLFCSTLDLRGLPGTCTNQEFEHDSRPARPLCRRVDTQTVTAVLDSVLPQRHLSGKRPWVSDNRMDLSVELEVEVQVTCLTENPIAREAFEGISWQCSEGRLPDAENFEPDSLDARLRDTVGKGGTWLSPTYFEPSCTAKDTEEDDAGFFAMVPARLGLGAFLVRYHVPDGLGAVPVSWTGPKTKAGLWQWSGVPLPA
mmetsp:Transcript_11769/g.26254  ORF Transcript_11769/g.26254 Transcript_11769/m.26254 type:complete len:334 (-) Transcript_11769:74-1075(-)